MEPEARVAELEKENDALHEQLGIESPRMAREREVREADAERQRQRDALEGTGLAEYLECLEGQGLHAEWDALDRLEEGILVGWQLVLQARAGRMAAQKRIEQFVEAFGGSLPPSWEHGKREWVDKQPRRPEASSGQVWHRNRLSQVIRGLVGRIR
jgi:hypothetical protein